MQQKKNLKKFQKRKNQKLKKQSKDSSEISAEAVLSEYRGKLPAVAIIGRRNVGKSTLFNLLYGKRRAIVDDYSGVTVDALSEFVLLNNTPFELIDLPGLDLAPDDDLTISILESAKTQLTKVNLVLLVLEYPLVKKYDHTLYEWARKNGKKIIVLINKVDSLSATLNSEDDENSFYSNHDFTAYYEMGISDFIPISARGRKNIPKLRNSILAQFPDAKTIEVIDLEIKAREKELNSSENKIDDPSIIEDKANSDNIDVNNIEENSTDKLETSLTDRNENIEINNEALPIEEADSDSDLSELALKATDKAPEDLLKQNNEQIKVAIVGKPNSGKSSILNRILGFPKVVVSPIAGTTRDYTHTRYQLEYKGKERELLLLDTAGIQKKPTAGKKLEFYSYTRAKEAITMADVIIQVIDAREGFHRADKRIGMLIKEMGKPSLLALNKWDLVDLENKTYDVYLEDMLSDFPFARSQEIISISAIEGKRIPRLVEMSIDLFERSGKKYSTSFLNKLLENILKKVPYQNSKKPPVLRYAVQTSLRPLIFRFYVKKKESFSDNIITYIEKKIRKKLDLKSIPMKIEIKAKQQDENREIAKKARKSN